MNLTADKVTNLRLKALLMGLVAPLAVLVLSLKTLRVLGRRELEQISAALPLYRSDVLLLLLFALTGSLLISFATARRKNFVLGVLQLAAILWVGIETLAHQFYVVTGSTIDLGIFMFSLQRIGDTSQVFTSEIPLLMVLLLGEVVLVMVFLPWYIVRRSAVDENPRGLGRKALLSLVSLGFVSSAWSILPQNESDNPGIYRSNLINFAFSMARLDDQVETGEVMRESLRGLRLSAPAGQQRHKNLVLVILESTRASATTLYNPDLPTTPFLNSLKPHSLFAEQAYAVVPHTSKALVAMLCGIEPHLTMPITEAGPQGIPSRCLAELLGDAGYQSVFFQSATRQFEARDGLVANLGFETFYPLESFDSQNMERTNYFGVEDAVMLPGSRKWLESNADNGPFLATYLTSAPHHDYLAPRQRYGFKNFSEQEEFNRYLNSVRYVDQFSRELLDQYRELGLYEDSLFVFIGDHGEAFNEHGRNQHDNIMWDEGLHIPLLIYDPSAPVGRTISTPLNQLDLLPTLLELLGFSLDNASVPGEVFWEADTDRTLYAHCWYELQCMAAIQHGRKYIEHFGRRKNELYDLNGDSGESLNLHRQLQPDEIEQRRIELFTWRRSVNSLYTPEL